MKHIWLHDFLTKEEIQQISFLYRHLRDTGMFAELITRAYVQPNIERINKSLRQNNSPKYLAYAIEAAFDKKYR